MPRLHDLHGGRPDGILADWAGDAFGAVGFRPPVSPPQGNPALAARVAQGKAHHDLEADTLAGFTLTPQEARTAARSLPLAAAVP